MSEDTVSLTRLANSHDDLLTQLTALEALAHDLRGHPGPAAIENLDERIVLLRSRLGTLMGTEERAVYPRLARDVGALDAQAMVEEHQEIRHWLHQLVAAWAKLERPAPDLETVRSILLVLVGLIRLHLRREDKSYLRMVAYDVEPRDAARHQLRVPKVA